MFRPTTAVPALMLTLAIGAAAPACASGRYYQRHLGPARLTATSSDSPTTTDTARDSGTASATRRTAATTASTATASTATPTGEYSYGDRGDYRRFYRNGYEAGYAEGYNRRGTVGRQQPGPGLSHRDSGKADGTSYASPATQKSGIEMAWKPDATTPATVRRNDPRRSKRYRDGDHDYNDRYSYRNQYKTGVPRSIRPEYESQCRDNRR